MGDLISIQMEGLIPDFLERDANATGHCCGELSPMH